MRSRGGLAAVLLSVALLSPPGAAPAAEQELPPYDSAHPVEIPPIGPFYGVRLRGLGGAYTAVAEGAEGTLTSLASLANRRPDEAGYFNWGLMLSWLFPAGDLDVSNTGRVSPAGFRLLATGVVLRFGRLGIGVFHESMGMSDVRGTGRDLRTNRAVAGAAYALPGDAWVVGLGVHSVGYRMHLIEAGTVESSHPHLGADLLFRPPDQTYRLGASLKLRGWTNLPELEGATLPPAVVRPWEASIGGALWLGDGVLNKPMPTTDYAEPLPPARTGLLLTMDLFVVGAPPGRGTPVAGLEAYFEDKLQIVRQRRTAGIRIGGETEAVPDRVRVRGGFWLEPSRFSGVGRRLHWTGGLDYLLFELLDYQWRASLVFDLASHYRIGGISVGLW